MPNRKNLIQYMKNYLYLLPLVALVLFLFLYPISYAVYISFTNFSVEHFFKYSFVGLYNYAVALSSGVLTSIIEQTLIWTVGSIAAMVTMGLILAIILNQHGFRFRKPMFVLMLFPWAFPAFISLLVWEGMWNYEYGIINKLLGLIGIGAVNWFNSTPTAWILLIVTNLWLSFPYYTAVFLSMLQSIPNEYFEAARVDGASTLQQFRSITVPVLKQGLAFIILSGFIFTWNNFYPIYLLTGGAPGISTDILTVYSYQQAFSYDFYGLGAAYSIISTVILAVMAIVMIKYTKMLEVIT